MATPNFYITKSIYDSIIGPGFFSIQDLPAERAEQVRPHFNNSDTLGVFASGIAPKQDPNAGYVVGGMDWVRLEPNDKRKVGEPALNVYHYDIHKPDENGYPVYACRNGTSIAGHWSELKDLDVYWITNTRPIEEIPPAE